MTLFNAIVQGIVITIILVGVYLFGVSEGIKFANKKSKVVRI